ncbi:hypothetical protein GCM10007973_17190 [Polymorphobacter multimanifer]|nr:hypothetical protein GCM10007973_17190 [Polymorphobacter multimanifer]
MNAYCGPPPTPMDWVSQWNFDPFVIGGLLLLLGAGFRAQRDHPDRQRSLVMAVGVFAILFLSPLCALTTALFSARVLHHLLLVAVAAPLLALTFAARATASAGGSFVVATMVFWAWHVPVLYTAALENTAIYWAMQASLVVTAFLF